jgi:peptidoglycan/xylan/chitin deacetylase (PgdA/CDA1 family)
VMRVPGRRFLRRALRPLARALFPGAVVLGYHRVAEVGWDPLGLAVSPSNFAAQLEVLRRRRELISLADLAARHAAGEPLEQYAVLTFDDGYRDFADTVVPIAERFEAPVTVFVATGFTGGTFWWEEAAGLLDPNTGGHGSLEVEVPGGERLRLVGLEHPEARAAAARNICDRLACAGPADIERLIRQLRAWRGTSGPVRTEGAPMTAHALAALARRPLAEIGAHTVSHGCLATLPPERQRAEIEGCKGRLETLTGTSVRVFSYPNGSLSPDTPALVEAAGFACACTSLDGMVSRRSDRFRMPRIWAPDAGAAAFARWLGTWATDRR